MLDMDGGGSIQQEELKIGLSIINIHPTEDELEGWIKDVDVNNDGDIDLVEFISFMINVKEKVARNKAQNKAKPNNIKRSSFLDIMQLKNIGKRSYNTSNSTVIIEDNNNPDSEIPIHHSKHPHPRLQSIISKDSVSSILSSSGNLQSKMSFSNPTAHNMPFDGDGDGVLYSHSDAAIEKNP